MTVKRFIGYSLMMLLYVISMSFIAYSGGFDLAFIAFISNVILVGLILLIAWLIK